MSLIGKRLANRAPSRRVEGHASRSHQADPFIPLTPVMGLRFVGDGLCQVMALVSGNGEGDDDWVALDEQSALRMLIPQTPMKSVRVHKS